MPQFRTPLFMGVLFYLAFASCAHARQDCPVPLAGISKMTRLVRSEEIEINWPYGQRPRTICFEDGCPNPQLMVPNLSYRIPASVEHPEIPPGVRRNSIVGSQDSSGDNRYSVVMLDGKFIHLSPLDKSKRSVKVPYDVSKGRSTFVYHVHARVNMGNRHHDVDFVIEDLSPSMSSPWALQKKHQSMEELVSQTLQNFPLSYVDSVRSIAFIGSKSHSSPTAAAYSYGDAIDFFDFDGAFPGAHITKHEFAHNLILKLTGSHEPPLGYIKAAHKDNKRASRTGNFVGVTNYGNTEWAEDFAEAFMYWLHVRSGGKLDAEETAHMKNLAHRFHYFDKDKLINSNPYIRNRRLQRSYLAFVGLVSLNAGGLGYCAKIGSDYRPSAQASTELQLDHYCANLFFGPPPAASQAQR
jgi:hypothetical protein